MRRTLTLGARLCLAVRLRLAARLSQVACLCVAACLCLAACGPQSTTHHRPGTAHDVVTGPATPAPGQAHAEITITRGRVSPPPGWLEVAEGSPVTITVTSDTPDELHVHGYDIKAGLPAGKPVTVRFTAGLTGVFAVETHRAKLVLTQVAVR
ncbi:hypothetical protein [Thermoactinospora rubra]|uniref:hypothetical protein n=1 Tax=Thermoactinospora rubra TaxID=1088767 RepID=UPI0019802C7B|nr:hypothetical protein [Thermoactinospora rubra]